jgi:hypothetical protein
MRCLSALLRQLVPDREQRAPCIGSPISGFRQAGAARAGSRAFDASQTARRAAWRCRKSGDGKLTSHWRGRGTLPDRGDTANLIAYL